MSFSNYDEEFMNYPESMLKRQENMFMADCRKLEEFLRQYRESVDIENVKYLNIELTPLLRAIDEFPHNRNELIRVILSIYDKSIYVEDVNVVMTDSHDFDDEDFFTEETHSGFKRSYDEFIGFSLPKSDRSIRTRF
ncbi:unnamed protein product [Phytophthora lilii]|uniref:Unnamed protein product n=1 Tax=Phytophthora lilii TaxID=2077276 RepID=A0A9W6YJU7_9STRA|nr:unnamed protein product [Phytophthora lilii]